MRKIQELTKERIIEVPENFYGRLMSGKCKINGIDGAFTITIPYIDVTTREWHIKHSIRKGLDIRQKINGPIELCIECEQLSKDEFMAIIEIDGFEEFQAKLIGGYGKYICIPIN